MIEGHRKPGPIHDAVQQTSSFLAPAATSFLRRLNPDTIARVHCGDDGATPPRFVTAYWSTRGIGAAIRMLLFSSRIPHWVLLYDVLEGDNCSWDKSSWTKDKTWLSVEVTPLINLPYLVDLQDYKRGNNPTVMVHSNAILSFLDCNFLALTAPDRSRSIMEQLLCEVMDLRDAMISFAYQPATNDSDLERDGRRLILSTAEPMLQRLEKYLVQKWDGITLELDKVPHLVDDRASAPDYHLFEVLDQYNGLSRVVLGDDSMFGLFHGIDRSSKYPLLSHFYRSFRRAKLMEGFFSSDLYKLPYNNPYARFGPDPLRLRNYQKGQAAPWRALGLLDIS